MISAEPAVRFVGLLVLFQPKIEGAECQDGVLQVSMACDLLSACPGMHEDPR